MMTTRELAQALMSGPDIEVGFFDSEGHWCKVTRLNYTQVDEANWRPFGSEQQTGTMRQVIELSDDFQ